MPMNKPKQRVLLVGTGLITFFCATPYAKPTSIKTQIDNVTVFPDRALVQRYSVKTELVAGQNQLVVAQLPATLLPDTLRAQGVSDTQVSITSVELVRIPMRELTSAQEQRLSEELTALTDQKRTFEDQIKSLHTRLNFISAIGNDLPNTINQDIARGMVNPTAWEQAWQTLEAGTKSSYASIHQAQIDIRDLDASITQLQAQLANIKTGSKEELQAHISVHAEHSGSIQLQLAYQVHGAAWQPLYDARLNTENGTVQLTQLAQVRQNTGEDWHHALLTLSTAQPSRSGQMPTLTPWWINFMPSHREQDNFAPMAMRSKEKNAGNAAPMLLESESVAHAPSLSTPARAQQANLVATEFATAYQIPTRINVPADNALHKFTVDDHHLASTLSVRTTPKLSAQAYLHAVATYSGEAPLLAGKLALYRDEAFISSSTLAALAPGQELSLSYGLDEKVSVDYKQITGTQGEQGIINKERYFERQYKVVLQNHHTKEMPITVYDQLPAPQHEEIKVQLLKSSATPTTLDVENQTGVLAWNRTLAPGKKTEILFGYSVTYPIEQQVPGF